jgi:hypothetical protein
MIICVTDNVLMRMTGLFMSYFGLVDSLYGSMFCKLLVC